MPPDKKKIQVFMKDREINENQMIIVESLEWHRNNEFVPQHTYEDYGLKHRPSGCPFACHGDLIRTTSDDILKLIKTKHGKWQDVTKVIFSEETNGLMYIGYGIDGKGLAGGLINGRKIINFSVVSNSTMKEKHAITKDEIQALR